MADRVISAVLTLRDGNFSSTASQAASNTRELEQRIRYAGNTIGRFGRSATSSFTNVAKSVVGLAAAYMGFSAVKDLTTDMIELAAAAKATEAQFEQVFTGIQSNAENALNRVAEETQVLPSRLKGSFISMAAFAKTAGADGEKALSIAERATLAAADGAAFYDKSIEEVTESLQSFLKGNFANDAALGISATEMTRNAAAADLFGKKYKDLTELQKQETLLKMVEDGNKLSGAMGQASREGDGFENVIGNLKQSWADLKANMGQAILEPVVKVLQGMTTAVLNFDPKPVTSFLEKSVKFGKTVKDVFWTIKESVMSLYYDTGEVSDLWQNLGLPKNVSDNIASFGEVLRTVARGIGTVKETIMSLYYDTGEVSDLWQNMGFSERTSDLIATFAELLKTTIAGSITFVKDAAVGTFNFIKNNWSLIGPVIAGVAASVAALKMGIVAITAVKTTWTAVTTAVQVATALLNGTLAISPLGWVAIAIGVVVTAGILLWKNWDTVIEKAGQLWEWLKKVWSGIEKGFASAWQAVQRAAGSAINFMIDKVNGVISLINKIPGVEIEAVGKVNWGKENLPKNAMGTSYFTGGPTLIHERGGEIVDLPNGSRIYPHDKSVQMARNESKGNPITININGVGKSTNDIVNEMVPALKLALSNM
ncbi:hypothetical protein [Bacillus sp. JJ1474]|uniref:hypothetical protein n=1 Tax=Bacillus sp. JJ1474 TaxID=3122955 RepID=UPI002FFE366B